MNYSDTFSSIWYEFKEEMYIIVLLKRLCLNSSAVQFRNLFLKTLLDNLNFIYITLNSMKNAHI